MNDALIEPLKWLIWVVVAYLSLPIVILLSALLVTVLVFVVAFPIMTILEWKRVRRSK